VTAVYQRLKRKESNFGRANQDLLSIQNNFILAPDLPPQAVKERLKPPTRTVDKPLFTEAPAVAPIAPPKSVNKSKSAASLKGVCDQKQVLLDALLLEKENWERVTASLNASFKSPLDRATAEQTQDMQSREREEKIKELSMYREKNCR
jgi:hypothetical protein